MKRVVLLLVALAAFGCGRKDRSDDIAVKKSNLDAAKGLSTPAAPQNLAGEQALLRAIADRATGVQVEGEGEIVKVLSDDRDGDRHQRFIIRLKSGQTLLIAHNIDQAQRVPSAREGDALGFFGEYEWNNRGGVIHWTHRDSRRRHESGWLKHKGNVYQ